MYPFASTILEQLGGQTRLSMMTGAKNFRANREALIFDIPKRGGERQRFVMIGLERGRDTYKVQVDRMARDFMIENVAKADDVYAGDLAAVFADLTGLAVVV